MPIKKRKKQRRRRVQPRGEDTGDYSLDHRLENGLATLQSDDVIDLIGELSLISRLKTSFWETLCHVSRLCGKNRRVQLRDKATGRYEKQLDICSFATVETNLALLISLLLTK